RKDARANALHADAEGGRRDRRLAPAAVPLLASPARAGVAAAGGRPGGRAGGAGEPARAARRDRRPERAPRHRRGDRADPPAPRALPDADPPARAPPGGGARGVARRGRAGAGRRAGAASSIRCPPGTPSLSGRLRLGVRWGHPVRDPRRTVRRGPARRDGAAAGWAGLPAPARSAATG